MLARLLSDASLFAEIGLLAISVLSGAINHGGAATVKPSYESLELGCEVDRVPRFQRLMGLASAAIEQNRYGRAPYAMRGFAVFHDLG